jgi:hypothetical protein
MRIEQPAGERGSLKWIQQAVNFNREKLNELILPKLGGATSVCWRSPLVEDQYAEYRDATFLDRVCAQQLTPELESFWRHRGPQWDALACTDRGDILLVEAKAHVDELCTPRSKASAESRDKIQRALDETALFAGAEPRAPWFSVFYQLANLIAHLYFLRKHGRSAWLVLINFIGDSEMEGPSSEGEWRAAYAVVWHVLGIPKRHALAPYIWMC